MTISLENEMNEVGFKFSGACLSLASAYESTILLEDHLHHSVCSGYILQTCTVEQHIVGQLFQVSSDPPTQPAGNSLKFTHAPPSSLCKQEVVPHVVARASTLHATRPASAASGPPLASMQEDHRQATPNATMFRTSIDQLVKHFESFSFGCLFKFSFECFWMTKVPSKVWGCYEMLMISARIDRWMLTAVHWARNDPQCGT